MNLPRILDHLAKIPSPAYVADEGLLRANMAVMARVKKDSGCEIIYAIKGCPLHPIFPILAQTLDGSTASGLYEARLGLEAFGKQVHVFCPAFTQKEVEDLLALTPDLHIYFNSKDQLEKFEPFVRKKSKNYTIGLRVNPKVSFTQHEKYNPCRTGSHLGVPLEELDTIPWEKVDTLHVHALCENMAEASAQLIDHVATKMARCVNQVKHVNFGGGHFITARDYDIDILIDALKRFKKSFPHVQTLLEPGSAHVHKAGYIVSTVLATLEIDGVKTAVLDASANCHVPDVHKAGIRLDVFGSGEPGEKKYTYTLAARTCMARDTWGDYSFDAPLKEGDKIIFLDGLQYSLGEANWFNGHPRPDLAMLKTDGSVQIFRHFTYEDFKRDLGA